MRISITTGSTHLSGYLVLQSLDGLFICTVLLLGYSVYIVRAQAFSFRMSNKNVQMRM